MTTVRPGLGKIPFYSRALPFACETLSSNVSFRVEGQDIGIHRSSEAGLCPSGLLPKGIQHNAMR